MLSRHSRESGCATSDFDPAVGAVAAATAAAWVRKHMSGEHSAQQFGPRNPAHATSRAAAARQTARRRARAPTRGAWRAADSPARTPLGGSSLPRLVLQRCHASGVPNFFGYAAALDKADKLLVPSDHTSDRRLPSRHTACRYLVGRARIKSVVESAELAIPAGSRVIVVVNSIPSSQWSVPVYASCRPYSQLPKQRQAGWHERQSRHRSPRFVALSSRVLL